MHAPTPFGSAPLSPPKYVPFSAGTGGGRPARRWPRQTHTNVSSLPRPHPAHTTTHRTPVPILVPFHPCSQSGTNNKAALFPSIVVCLLCCKYYPSVLLCRRWAACRHLPERHAPGSRFIPVPSSGLYIHRPCASGRPQLSATPALRRFPHLRSHRQSAPSRTQHELGSNSRPPTTCTCAPPRCSLGPPLERTLGCGNGLHRADAPLPHPRVRSNSAILRRAPPAWRVDSSPSPLPHDESFNAGGGWGRHTVPLPAFRRYQPGHAPRMARHGDCVHCQPAGAEPRGLQPLPDGEGLSCALSLHSAPRPPPALWSGHYTGPLAAGMVRGGCRTIPEARGRS